MRVYLKLVSLPTEVICSRKTQADPVFPINSYAHFYENTQSFVIR